MPNHLVKAKPFDKNPSTRTSFDKNLIRQKESFFRYPKNIFK